MRPRHEDCVFDRADYQTTQPLPIEDQALQEVIQQPERDENEIREIYGLPALSERGLDEWIASAVEE